jgi:drug/metabolite transporter (DMT)-like permease
MAAMHSLQAKDRQGIVSALAGFSLFAIGDLFIKFLADDGFAPAEIAFFLQWFFLPLLVLVSRWIGGLRPALRTRKLPLHLLRSLCGVTIFFLIINGFRELGLATSYTLVFAGPFFATLLSVLLLKDRVGPWRWLSVLAGFVGVVIVLRPGIERIEPAALGVLLAALLFAFAAILVRRIGEDEPLPAFALYGSLVSLLVFGIASWWDGQARVPRGTEWLLFAAIGIFHVGGSLLTSRAFAMTETALVAPFHYVQLLWGTVFGVLFFAAIPDVWTALGASVIVGSGLFLIYREHLRHGSLTTGLTAHGEAEAVGLEPESFERPEGSAADPRATRAPGAKIPAGPPDQVRSGSRPPGE